MQTQEELKETADAIFNHDFAHLNCEVVVEPFEGNLEIRIKPRRFDYHCAVVARPDKPDQNIREELEAMRDTMVENIFGDAFHER